jgi:GNAT superfamily N-acetyltransferase
MEYEMIVKIVNFLPGDYSKLITIWEKSGLPYKPNGRDSRESIEKETKLKCNQFLFAVFNENYVGTILVTHDGRKGWVNRLAVLPEFRGLGIAGQLVEAAENWLEEQGIGIYACLIEDYNQDSFEAFKKMGYAPFEGIHYLTKRKYPEI